ncbi:hypothetical protein COV18_00380 [Candidatus Woesearchaeota archaeon CG10_big_fil_rev_8_21_14_0_10_37_12]|nr:MAG: hypothetical protein COV18_00380 [Candidatus Woesearchaeota archaeon CG10_big_fil_rev_8_21_14_0_10_37_12]
MKLYEHLKDAHLVPYFKEFSRRGITARVLSVDDADIEVEEVEGARLNILLDDARPYVRPDVLKGIYRTIGTHLGVLAAACIDHGDLHPENIVIRRTDGHPIFIDWDHANIIDPNFADQPDIDFLLMNTKGYLTIEETDGFDFRDRYEFSEDAKLYRSLAGICRRSYERTRQTVQIPEDLSRLRA